MTLNSTFEFNHHRELEGKHAFLSPSKYHWVNYDDDKFDNVYNNFKAVQMGTRLHALAAEHILLGLKMPRTKKTLNMYINDAIGYRMTPEQPLYFSDYCFGTADAIYFDGKLLRIHDLKTGMAPASMKQLEIYAAIFFLEYGVLPSDVQTELRIYQMDEVLVHEPSDEDLVYIMDRIKYLSKRIDMIEQ